MNAVAALSPHDTLLYVERLAGWQSPRPGPVRRPSRHPVDRSVGLRLVSGGRDASTLASGRDIGQRARASGLTPTPRARNQARATRIVDAISTYGALGPFAVNELAGVASLGSGVNAGGVVGKGHLRATGAFLTNDSAARAVAAWSSPRPPLSTRRGARNKPSK